jgi:hypothetical protein
VFLNHGSFGACPRPVFDEYQRWQRELERQPVEFLARRLDGLIEEAKARLAAKIGTRSDDLAFVTNATSGMNVVARSLPLGPGDEVLVSNHEYGAVDLLWQHVCARSRATLVRAGVRAGPGLVGELWSAVTPRTRVISVSHLTSATAIVFPVEEICRRARPGHPRRRRRRTRAGPARPRRRCRRRGLLRGQLPQVALRAEGRRLPPRAARAPGRDGAARGQLGLEARRGLRGALPLVGYARSRGVPRRPGRDRLPRRARLG